MDGPFDGGLFGTTVDQLVGTNVEKHLKVYTAIFERDICLPSGMYHLPNTFNELHRIADGGMFGYTIVIVAVATMPNGTLVGSTQTLPCVRAHTVNTNMIVDRLELRAILNMHVDIPAQNIMHLRGSHADITRMHDLINATKFTTDPSAPVAFVGVFQDMARPNPYILLPDVPQKTEIILPTQEFGASSTSKIPYKTRRDIGPEFAPIDDISAREFPKIPRCKIIPKTGARGTDLVLMANVKKSVDQMIHGSNSIDADGNDDNDGIDGNDGNTINTMYNYAAIMLLIFMAVMYLVISHIIKK